MLQRNLADSKIPNDGLGIKESNINFHQVKIGKQKCDKTVPTYTTEKNVMLLLK